MKFVIKNPSPTGPYLSLWGDYHFGAALQRALEALGVTVEQHYWPDWDRDTGEDVVLVLRGKRTWRPPMKPRRPRYLLWIVSHPADVTPDECDAYDLIYCASETHLHLLKAATKTAVALMRQCTDTQRFSPPDRTVSADAEARRDMVFVGNSRGVRRPLVQWAVDAGYPPVIIGREWHRFGFKDLVRQKWIAPEQLPALYRNARLCLNDHWLDMRALGVVNNRVFDALACGLPVLSDHFPELEQIVGDGVLFARNTDEVRRAMGSVERDYPGLLERTRAAWRRLRDEFSFDARAHQLLAELEHPPAPPAVGAEIALPASWMRSFEQGFREELKAQATRLAAEQARLDNMKSGFDMEKRRLAHQLDRPRRARGADLDNLRALRREAELLRTELDIVYSSPSWRIVRPLRIGAALLRGRKPNRTCRAAAERRLAGRQINQPRSGGGSQPPQPIRKLDAKLWGGYRQGALEELHALLGQRLTAPWPRAWAAWVLARYYLYQGDAAKVLKLARKMAQLDGRRQNDKRRVLIEAEALLLLEQAPAAIACLDDALGKHPDQPDLLLARITALVRRGLGGPDPEQTQLELINQLFRRDELAELVKRDPARALGLENIAAPAVPIPSEQTDWCVSIIMPVFNAATTVEWAIRSLLEQTWTNLQIIAIDDCSDDDSASVIQRWAAQDGRIQYLRQPRNAGAYAARNAGLALASGDFVTTHDSDDWSHPEKIALQVWALESHPDAEASVSFWCRARRDLTFRGTERPSGQYVQWNHSSLLFRREVLDQLGAWDPVRVGADTELVLRLERLVGPGTVVEVKRGVPLSFALAEPTSLTRAKETSAVTLYQGLRREYREAAAYWHHSTKPGDALRLDPSRTSRPFPAPYPNLPGKPARPAYDLLFIMDWNLDGGAYVSSLNYVLAARAYGLKVAVFHRRRPDLDLSLPLNPQMRKLAATGAVDVICPGESIRAHSVLIGYPPVFRERMENGPQVECTALGIIVNQMADRLYSKQDPQYDPQIVAANVAEELGLAPIWLPISGHVRSLMHSDNRYGRVSTLHWTPLINPDSYQRRQADGRRDRPVVGRHARDHYTKWPRSKRALRAAYCANKPCEVHLLGGADIPKRMLGKLPENWTVHPFDGRPVTAFLAGLDFFVHYPNEDYIEEFGRSVLEAMASGVVAVLPERFHETFGDAAVYAPPDDVWKTVSRLWSSPLEMSQQIEQGLNFVRTTAGYDQLAIRLASLETPRSGEGGGGAASRECAPLN